MAMTTMSQTKRDGWDSDLSCLDSTKTFTHMNVSIFFPAKHSSLEKSVK